MNFKISGCSARLTTNLGVSCKEKDEEQMAANRLQAYFYTKLIQSERLRHRWYTLIQALYSSVLLTKPIPKIAAARADCTRFW
jgi:hypothetical protein